MSDWDPFAEFNPDLDNGAPRRPVIDVPLPEESEEMAQCYWCYAEMSDSALDGHVATAHPQEVMPMKPSEVHRVATKRGDDKWDPMDGSK